MFWAILAKNITFLNYISFFNPDVRPDFPGHPAPGKGLRGARGSVIPSFFIYRHGNFEWQYIYISDDDEDKEVSFFLAAILQ